MTASRRSYFRSFRPRVRHLEDRCVPATTPTSATERVFQPHVDPYRDTATLFATGGLTDHHDYYIADGNRIDLYRRMNEVAVKVTDRGVVDALTRRGSVFEFFQPTRWLGQNTVVLTTPLSPAIGPSEGRQLVDGDARLVTAESIPGVTWTAPVFQATDIATWLVATDEVVVSLKDGVTPDAFFANHSEFSSFRHLDGSVEQYIGTLADGPGVLALDAALELPGEGQVNWATPNFYQHRDKHFIPGESLFRVLWHLENSGISGGVADADVDASKAWDVTTGKSSITIAIVDDSVYFDHDDYADPSATNFPPVISGPEPHFDLASGQWFNAGEMGMDTAGGDKSMNMLDDDGNGYIDDVTGFDVVDLDMDGNYTYDAAPGFDSDTHGTNVAGVAAARGNNKVNGQFYGVAGIAFGCRIMSVRVGLGPNVISSDADLAAAVRYGAGLSKDGKATFAGAQVVNCSWGGFKASPTLTSAFTDATTKGAAGKGASVFISSGNDFDTSISYPANLSVSNPGLAAVGASTNLDERSAYSNFGDAASGHKLSFVAPSSGGSLGIGTTDRYGNLGYTTSEFNGSFGGTSSASPLAAGIAALVRSVAPTLTAAQIRGLMYNTTDLVGPDTITYDAKTGFNEEFGGGRVNANAAVRGATKAEIQILDGRVDIPDNTGSVVIDTELGVGVTKTFRVRNQGALDLTLSNLKITAGPAAISALGATTLKVGESTTFTVTFNPSTRGTSVQTVTMTTNDKSTGIGDPDETAYDFKITTRGLTPSIRGTFYDDVSDNGALDSKVDPTLRRWTAYLDANQNGQLDQTPATFNAAGLPFAIPDLSIVSSPILVTGFASQVFDVNVKIDIAHTWNEDLSVALISPLGVRVQLFDKIGGSSDNFHNTVFDDSATVEIGDGTGPYTGTFHAAGDLSDLYFQNPNGVWTLEVTDHTSGDAGVLNAWQLILATGETTAVSDATGNYTFFDIEPGTYDVRRITQPGWTDGREPAGGKHVVNVASTTSKTANINFGQLHANSVYGKIYDDKNFSGAFEAGETVLPGWRAYLDANNNGLYDANESTATFNSTDVPVPIPDLTTTKSQLVVSGANPVLHDINVKFDISHTFDSDLTITLRAPNGTAIPLVVNRGAAGQNFTATVLDDEAATAISKGTAPFTGSFRPDNPLDGFDGINPNGIWTLEITDDFAPDPGTLNSWSVEITAAKSTTVTTLDIPKPILDGATAGSILTVSGQTGVIHDLNVKFNITHSFDADLAIKLTAPNGLSIPLVLNRGMDQDDFIDTVLDDQAATAIQDGTAPFQGRFRPETPLSSFVGINPNGVWKLEVTDVALGDQGLFNNWSLEITTAEHNALSNPDGVYQLADIPAGSYNVRRVVEPGYTPTQPVGDLYSVTFVGGETFTGRDFGQTKATPPASAKVASFVVDDGSTQRSLVRSLTVTFDQVVTLPPTPADAFTLTGPNGPVTLAVDTSGSTPTQTIAKLTFSGATTTEFTSLTDGDYVFNIIASKVTTGGVPLDGNNDGLPGGDYVASLHRLFGDKDGDRDVDATDFGAFRTAFGTASIFDFDNDGDTDTSDFGQFRTRFGTMI